MKTSSQSSLAAFVAAVSMILPLAANLSAASAPAAPAKEAHAEAPKPTTSAAALDAIRKLQGEIKAKVAAKQLAGIHDLAEHMVETANLLPALSKTLAADKLARVDGAVKNLVKALDSLHDAADGGNQAETERQARTVDTLLTLIYAQYAPPPADEKKAAAK